MTGPELVEAVTADCRNNVPLDVRAVPVVGSRADLRPGDLFEVGPQPLPHGHRARGHQLALPLGFQQAADLSGNLSACAAGQVLAVRLAVAIAQEHRAAPAPVRQLIDRALAVTPAACALAGHAARLSSVATYSVSAAAEIRREPPILTERSSPDRISS